MIPFLVDHPLEIDTDNHPLRLVMDTHSIRAEPDGQYQMGITAINRREVGMKTDETIARSPTAQAVHTRPVMEVNDAKTLTVPEAGRRYFNLGRNASYEAAKRGDLPVIRIGSRLRVSVAALERML